MEPVVVFLSVRLHSVSDEFPVFLELDRVEIIGKETGIAYHAGVSTQAGGNSLMIAEECPQSLARYLQDKYGQLKADASVSPPVRVITSPSFTSLGKNAFRKPGTSHSVI